MASGDARLGRRLWDNDLTSVVVFASLIPIFLFAILSWGIALWSHWRYRASRGYYGDFDPTDITQAIIASSAGGLSTAFDRRALADDQGLYGARKVSVRLGRVLDANDPDGKPRLGFVQYD